MVLIERKGMQLHYSFRGIENTIDKPIVFLIHGALGDLSHFDKIGSILLDSGFRVLTCDIRYHGLSQPVHNDLPCFHFQDVLEDLEFILLEIVRTHYSHQMSFFIGGLSMGGVLSLLFSQKHKDQSWLVSHNISLRGIIPIASLIPTLLSPRSEWKVFIDPVPNHALIKIVKAEIMQSASLESSQTAIKKSMETVSDASFYQCLRSVALCLLAEKGHESPPANLPTLLIIPEKDDYVRLDMERLYEINLRHCISCQKAIIKDALHMVILDHSALVASHIAHFCK